MTQQVSPICKNSIGHMFELQAQGVLRDVKFEILNHPTGKRVNLAGKKKVNGDWLDLMSIGYGRNTALAKLDAAKKFLNVFF